MLRLNNFMHFPLHWEQVAKNSEEVRHLVWQLCWAMLEQLHCNVLYTNKHQTWYASPYQGTQGAHLPGNWSKRKVSKGREILNNTKTQGTMLVVTLHPKDPQFTISWSKLQKILNLMWSYWILQCSNLVVTSLLTKDHSPYKSQTDRIFPGPNFGDWLITWCHLD